MFIRMFISTVRLGNRLSIMALALYFTFSFTHLSSQDHVWSRSLSGLGISSSQNISPGQNLSKGIALDHEHNIYLTGYSIDSVDFDPGEGEEILVAGNSDIFLAKYDSAGNYLWAHVLATEGFNQARDVATDMEGNAVIVGRGSNAADFDPGLDEAILGSGSEGGMYGFIAKYNSDGNYLWALAFESGFRQVATDPSGNIYVSGGFSQSFDVDPGPDEMILNPDGGGVSLAKFSPNGQLMWAHSLSGTGNLGTPTSISICNNGDLLIAGSFGNSVDFDPSESDFILNAETLSDRFFAKYSSAGNLLWARGLNVNGHWAGGGSGGGETFLVKENSEGEIITTGNFKGLVDFDPGPQVEYVNTGLNRSTFFSKYTAEGNFMWVKAIQSTYTQVLDLNIDCRDNIYLTGSLIHADFDPAGDGYVPLTSNVQSAFTHFMARYDSDGNYESVVQVGGSTSGPAICHSIVANNYWYLSGGFRQVQDFDPDTSALALLQMSGASASFNTYFAKYRVAVPTDTFRTRLCPGDTIFLNDTLTGESFLWQDGSVNPQLPVFSPGEYEVNITQDNCTKKRHFFVEVDSLIEPDLGRDTTLCDGEEWTYFYPGENGSLLWQDGDTSTVYTVSAEGTYIVEATAGACMATDSVNIIVVDCTLEIPNVFTPNGDGRNDRFLPRFGNGIQVVKLVIRNRWGRVVYTTENMLFGWDGYLDGAPASAGEYYFTIEFTAPDGVRRITGTLSLFR